MPPKQKGKGTANLQFQSDFLQKIKIKRWDAHANATSALLDGFDAIANALEHLHDDKH